MVHLGYQTPLPAVWMHSVLVVWTDFCCMTRSCSETLWTKAIGGVKGGDKSTDHSEPEELVCCTIQWRRSHEGPTTRNGHVASARKEIAFCNHGSVQLAAGIFAEPSVREAFLSRILDRCMLHSQLTFLAKLGSDTPGPSCVVDHLRRICLAGAY